MKRFLASALLIAASCGSPPAPRAAPPTPATTASELVGCYRVDSKTEPGATVVTSEEQPANGARPPGFEDGTLYCIERDRFFVKPPGGKWNVVITDWRSSEVWEVEGAERKVVGASWSSDGAPRLIDAPAPVIEIDIDDGTGAAPTITHWDPDVVACPIQVESRGGPVQLKGAWTVPLVALDPSELQRAQAEIKALELPEDVCAAARQAIRDTLQPDAESAPPSWAREVQDLESCRIQTKLAKAGDPRRGKLRECGSTLGARCPYGSSRQHGECVYREVIRKLVCPKGSKRVGEVCVMDYVYPSPPTEAVLTPVPAPAPPRTAAPAASGTAFAMFNSIPQCQVIVDGRPLGQTPIMKARLTAGRHTVIFVHPEHGRKARSFELRAGETKTVVVRFP